MTENTIVITFLSTIISLPSPLIRFVTAGLSPFITSSGTMDKDESVRRYLAARAEFLGAIRLPNDTFKGVAGTEVTSDIIFLKKRDSVLERDEDWIHLAER